MVVSRALPVRVLLGAESSRACGDDKFPLAPPLGKLTGACSLCFHLRRIRTFAVDLLLSRRGGVDATNHKCHSILPFLKQAELTPPPQPRLTGPPGGGLRGGVGWACFSQAVSRGRRLATTVLKGGGANAYEEERPPQVAQVMLPPGVCIGSGLFSVCQGSCHSIWP